MKLSGVPLWKICHEWNAHWADNPNIALTCMKHFREGFVMILSHIFKICVQNISLGKVVTGPLLGNML